jgi:hypothetical protein
MVARSFCVLCWRESRGRGLANKVAPSELCDVADVSIYLFSMNNNIPALVSSDICFPRKMTTSTRTLVGILRGTKACFRAFGGRADVNSPVRFSKRKMIFF